MNLKYWIFYAVKYFHHCLGFTVLIDLNSVTQEIKCFSQVFFFLILLLSAATIVFSSENGWKYTCCWGWSQFHLGGSSFYKMDLCFVIFSPFSGKTGSTKLVSFMPFLCTAPISQWCCNGKKVIVLGCLTHIYNIWKIVLNKCTNFLCLYHRKCGKLSSCSQCWMPPNF